MGEYRSGWSYMLGFVIDEQRLLWVCLEDSSWLFKTYPGECTFISILNTVGYVFVYLCAQASTYVKHVLAFFQFFSFHVYVLFLEKSAIQCILMIVATKNGAILVPIHCQKGKLSPE